MSGVFSAAHVRSPLEVTIVPVSEYYLVVVSLVPHYESYSARASDEVIQAEGYDKASKP